jgi:nicotinamide mononucleotide (NMN) deamidase PncC
MKRRRPAVPGSLTGKKVNVRTGLALESEVLRLLETLALAESCTGGCIAHRRHECAGRVGGFSGRNGRLQQCSETKISRRPAKTLAAHGAVSEAVAREMAEGARKKFGADFAHCGHGHRRAGRRDEGKTGRDGFHRAGRRVWNGG